MMAESDSDLLRSYLTKNSVVIVDSNPSARIAIASNLCKLGAKRTSLALVATVEEGIVEIQRLKPKMVISDFMVGKRSGLDLIEHFQKAHEAEKPKDLVFVLITGNGSQSAVARAAEEDVDSFILKPYTFESFKRAFEQTIRNKLKPNDYIIRIEDGKKDLYSGKLDEAIQKFNSAKGLDQNPSLACYYLGQAEALKESLKKASNEYTEGLRYNKIHYKCMIGLFELLSQQNKHRDAYSVVRKIAQYFPANPKRLSSVLRLAIMTANFDDIEGYYRIFTHIEDRPDELVRYICSALSITGKYYMRTGALTRAMELFEKVAVSSAGRTSFLRYIVETLAENDRGQEIPKFLQRFPADARIRADYQVAEYISLAASGASLSDLVQRGRDLLQDGCQEPPVYRILIQKSLEAGFVENAEELARQASAKWPKLAEQFVLSTPQP